MRTYSSSLNITDAKNVQESSLAYKTAKLAIVYNISQLEQVCGVDAAAAGWYFNPKTNMYEDRNLGEVIALIHSELSEALEAARKDLPSDKIPGYSGLEEELADAIIRILDLSYHLNLRLGEAFAAKIEFNRNREDHKLENRGKKEGKQF
jgi:NTP pyrophosphatase (non-canonical NTP hydrolase)